ncbi:unnamed protein product [Ectocarpus sp. 6 AP-2014]
MHGGSNGIAGEGVNFSGTTLLWWSGMSDSRAIEVSREKKRPRTIRAVKRGRGGGIGDSPTRKRTKPNTNKPNEAMQGNPAGGATAAAEARRARKGVEPEDLYDRPERRSKVDAASDYSSFGRTAGDKTVAGVGRIVKCQFQRQRVRRR